MSLCECPSGAQFGIFVRCDDIWAKQTANVRLTGTGPHMASLFEKLASCRPVNRAAGTSISHEAQTFQEQVMQNVWDRCPPLNYSLPLHEMELAKLKGRRFGSLTIVGIAVKTSRLGRIWVCRCDCGKFCGRTTAAVKKLDQSEQCAKCSKFGNQPPRSSPSLTEEKVSEPMVTIRLIPLSGGYAPR